MPSTRNRTNTICMEEKEYNKIARVFQFLKFANHFSNYRYGGFNGNYKTYPVTDAQMPEDTMAVIEKLMTLKVVDFYELQYLKKHGYPSNYYDSMLIKKSDKEIGFHNQLSDILFYYLFSQFKDAASNLLKEIDSVEFNSAFGYWLNKDEYFLTYPYPMHMEIFKYFESKVPDFEIMHFHFTSLSDVISHDGRTSTFKIKRIEKSLMAFEGFNFEGIDLISE